METGRYLRGAIEEDAFRAGKMAFVSGPRQVGKTTLGKGLLRYVRDKERREVDLLVLRDGRPWLLAECKSDEPEPAPALRHFTQILRPVHAVQLVSRPGTDRPYPELGIRVVDYERFFSSLP